VTLFYQRQLNESSNEFTLKAGMESESLRVGSIDAKADVRGSIDQCLGRLKVSRANSSLREIKMEKTKRKSREKAFNHSASEICFVFNLLKKSRLEPKQHNKKFNFSLVK
jgi:hypothetical protein